MNSKKSYKHKKASLISDIDHIRVRQYICIIIILTPTPHRTRVGKSHIFHLDSR